MLRIFERSLFVLRGYIQRKYSYAWNFGFSCGEDYDYLRPSRDKTPYNLWSDKKRAQNSVLKMEDSLSGRLVIIYQTTRL